MLYYSMFCAVAIGVLMTGKVVSTGSDWTLFSYPADTNWLILGVSFINIIGVAFQTIALQNERSGFITLIGYLGLVYAFLGDLFIFSVVPSALEYVGVGLILILNLALVSSKLKVDDKQAN
jgi:drug/metabolite transporter (DMT)-like permease